MNDGRLLPMYEVPRKRYLSYMYLRSTILRLLENTFLALKMVKVIRVDENWTSSDCRSVRFHPSKVAIR